MGNISDIPLEFSECQSLANDLVAGLVLKKGPFWKAIDRLRREWNIAVQRRLPPETDDLHMPPGSVSNRGSAEWVEARLQWLDTLAAVLAAVPEKLRVVAVDWNQFASVCVLYDPPETQLLEFAELKLLPLSKQIDDRTRLELSGLPIRYTSDGMKAMSIEQRRLRRVIDELGKRHLEPLGLDVWELVKDIERTPAITQQYRDELSENPCRYYIEPGENTTAESVQEAFKLIAPRQEGRLVRRGQKGKDLLLCLQLAILHDRYNEPGEKDSRSRTCSYPRLAERYEDYYLSRGLSTRRLTERGVEEHVKTGQQALETASEGCV